MLNEQLAVPTMFEATQVTVVRPAGNALPDGGLHCTDGEGVPTAVGVKVTVALVRPASAQVVMSDGQVMAGGGTGIITTRNEQLAVLFAASDAMQVTVLVPVKKVSPLGGVQLTVTPGQLSVEVAT
jgi:hypothetical protein